MKTPLVEALRQAGDEPSTPDDVAGQDEHVLDDTELELMLSTGILPADAAADLDGDEPGTAEQDDNFFSDADSNLTLAPESADLPASLPTAASAGRRSRTSLVSLFAPLLCVGLIIAAGAMTLTYHWLGGSLANVDLASLSAHDRSQPVTGSDLGLDGRPNRFPLILEPQHGGEERTAQSGTEAVVRDQQLPESPADEIAVVSDNGMPLQ